MRPSNFWIPLRDAARNQGSEQSSAFSRGQRSHHPLSAYMNRHSYTPTLVHKGCVHTVGRRRVAIRCELLGHGGAAVA